MFLRLLLSTLGLLLALLVLPSWTMSAGDAPWLPVLVWTLCLVTMWRPHHGLALVVGLVPVSSAAAAVLGQHWFGFGLAEASCLALLAGWGLRDIWHVWRSREALPTEGRPLVAWLTIVIATGTLAATVSPPDTWWPAADYLTTSGHGLTWRMTLQMTTTALVALATLHICRMHACASTVVWSAMVGITGAAALNLNRLTEIALRHPEPWTRFMEVFGTLRVNTMFGDLNAAGSWFALALIVGLGQAWTGVHRWSSLVCAAIAAAGLVTTGSRTAMAAVGVVAVAVAVARLVNRSGGWKLLVLSAGVVVMLGSAWGIYRRGDPSYHVRYRIFMTETALAMIAAHPITGVGPGLYAARSPEFMPPPPYEWWTTPENAHNNFLQMVAESGAGAGLAFGWVIWGLLSAARRLAPGPGARVGLPLIAGLAGFLLTCLGGHPLLVVPVAAIFWVLTGVALGAVSPQAASGAGRGRAPAPQTPQIPSTHC